MVMDYREKAAELRRQVLWASNEAIEAISQALLKAHKLGMEEAARVADEYAATAATTSATVTRRHAEAAEHLAKKIRARSPIANGDTSAVR